eukprot:TRINITY_DN100410_c0_g1_i1.p1 TRINITY_DN100410_c0_g1~~TRINITY_DN100410_c0_g1_i1.p1  ORF type:complete len:258 (-),score=95.60 TRINITY_DN100410_c0_g1_i1:121-894(-)
MAPLRMRVALLSGLFAGAVGISDAVTGSTAALRGPVTSDALKKVKDIIKANLAESQDRLAEEATQATMCKAQLKDVKERLKTQTGVVEAAMKKLNEAKVADSKDLKDKLRDAQHQQIDAETALNRAKRGLKAKEGHELELVQPARPHLKVAASSGRDLFAGINHKAQDISWRSDAPTASEKEEKKRETEKALDEAKYELKQEMKSLKNVNKEYELLHDECMKNAGQKQTAEMRADARDQEIDNLEKAYDILGDKGPR